MKLPAFLRPLSIKERIARELASAEMGRLDAASAVELAAATFDMYQTRIERLREELKKEAST